MLEGPQPAGWKRRELVQRRRYKRCDVVEGEVETAEAGHSSTAKEPRVEVDNVVAREVEHLQQGCKLKHLRVNGVDLVEAQIQCLKYMPSVMSIREKSKGKKKKKESK